MTRSGQGSRLGRWLVRLALGTRLAGRFVAELLIANLEQARIILSWPMRVEPRWIEFETCLESGTARTLLGAMISLTPGTLTCDLEGHTLTVHALNASTDAEAVERIRQRFETLLVEMERVR